MEHIPYLWPVLPRYELSERGAILPQVCPGVARRHRWHGYVMRPQAHDYAMNLPRLWYAPAEHPELIAAIDKIKPGDTDSALAFVRTWGLLGRENLLGNLWDGEDGDPLWWIWGHARTIHWCLEATRALQAGDDGEIPLPTRGDEPLSLALRSEVQTFGWFDCRLKHRASRQGVLRKLRNDIVNQNISSMRRVLQVGDTGNQESHFTFVSLIEMIYWHLADAISGGKIQQCEASDCQAFFIQVDPRRRFCPAPNGQKESSCSLRHRVQQYRQDPQRREEERERARERYRRRRQKQP